MYVWWSIRVLSAHPGSRTRVVVTVGRSKGNSERLDMPIRPVNRLVDSVCSFVWRKDTADCCLGERTSQPSELGVRTYVKSSRSIKFVFPLGTESGGPMCHRLPDQVRFSPEIGHERVVSRNSFNVLTRNNIWVRFWMSTGVGMCFNLRSTLSAHSRCL